METIKRRVSLFTWYLLVIIYVFSFVQLKEGRDFIIKNGDSIGYYQYLPAFFIHGDISTYQKTTRARLDNIPGGGARLTESELPGFVVGKNRVQTYTMGVAMLQLPAFVIAHLAALAGDYKPDGFSYPYQLAISLNGLIWGLLGLWVLRKILLHFFTDKVTALVLLLIALATNLYHFAVFQMAMSHVYLFALSAIFLYAALRWHENPSYSRAILLGFAFGLIGLIRPNEVIVLILFLLFGVTGLESLKKRLGKIFTYRLQALAAGLTCLLCILPQLMLWKAMTGQYIYYSYQQYGFEWTSPHLWEGIFGFKNGWLAYTPVMVFSLLGIPWLCKEVEWRWPVLIFLPLHIYIIYSWTYWNYPNGFGSRAMVETYALLALPMGYFLQYTLQNNRVRLLWTLLVPLFTFLIALNMFQTWQYSKGMLRSEEGSLAFWKSSLFKKQLDYADITTFESGELQPRQTRLVKKILTMAFKDSLNQHYTMENSPNGHYSVRSFQGQEFINALDTSLGDIQVKGGEYVRFKARCFAESLSRRFYQSANLVMLIERGPEVTKWISCVIDNKLSPEDDGFKNYTTHRWDEVYFYMKIPESILPGDKLKCYIWNPNPHVILINEMEVGVYK